MAAGKTTAAKAIGAHLDWTATDLDAHIELHMRQTVAEIFTTHGEEYFRAAENRFLRELLPHRNTVIATGGGTFVSKENRELMNHDGVSVWIDVSLNTVRQRLLPDDTRPLAAERDSMARLYAARRRAYNDAHLHLKADRMTTDELVGHIVAYLDQI